MSWWLHRAATVMQHAKCCVQSDTKPFVLVYFISYQLLLEWCNYDCNILIFTSDWFSSYLVLVKHCIVAQLHMWANSKLIKVDLSQKMDKMNVQVSLQVTCLKGFNCGYLQLTSHIFIMVKHSQPAPLCLLLWPLPSTLHYLGKRHWTLWFS